MIPHIEQGSVVNDHAAGRAPAKDLPSEPRGDKRVVVLAGDSATKQLTPDVFSGLGIELLTAVVPQKAVEMLSRTKAPVFVTEVSVSGVDFLGALRKRFPGLAIIVITGFDDAHLVSDTQLASAASTILSEPITQEDVVVAIPQAIRTDSGRLRQCLMNLAGNAVKFTSEGGVRISVGLAEAAGRFKTTGYHEERKQTGESQC